MSRIYRYVRISTPLAALAIAAVACGGTPSGAQEARRLLERGDYAGAERIADRELGRVPDHPSYWHIKIKAALASGDADEAVASYDRWHERRGAHDRGALASMAKTVLWQGLQVPAADLRVAAIESIERHEVEELAQDVIDLVAASDDRVAAAAAVAVIRVHPQAPQVLTDILGSPDAEARRIAVTGIGRKVGEHARDDLLPMLGDEASAVRRAAVRAIAGLDDDGDTAHLVTVAREDAEGSVRAAALQSLSRGDRDGLARLASTALDDDYLGARLAAVSLLARARGDDARPTLTELATGDDRLLALRAAIELAKLDGPPMLEPLERALRDQAWTVRASAVNAVSQIAPRRAALTMLGGALVDPRIEVRLAAARALLQLDQTERAIRELRDALDAPRADPRLEAAIDLVRIDRTPGLEALADLAANPDATTRARALRAHRYADGPTGALVAALADERIENRLIAADVLLELLDRDP